MTLTAGGRSVFPWHDNIGFRAGIVFSAGTHLMRTGICLNFYYIAQNFQFNTEARMYNNWRNLGPPGRHGEIVISQGVIYGFGEKDQAAGNFPGVLANHTGSRYSVGYAYNLWMNRIGTTQQTGAIKLGAYNLSLINENDIYARPALDRFRSGAFAIRYRLSDLAEAGIVCKIWTGHYRRKISTDTIPQFRNNCYMDSTGGTFTKYSHGIIAGDFSWALPYQQTVRAGAGIDAETIRNTIQNELMHNMRFIPQKWQRRKNCHLPMIDDKGGQYLYGKEQEVRKPRPYLELSANPSYFY